MKLTDDFVRDVPPADSKGGRKYADGHGFYLHVSTTGKYWRLAYRVAGKPKTLALGVFPAVSLEEARRKAGSARELLNAGVDPIKSKKAARQVQREAAHGLRPQHPGAMLRDVVLPGLSVSVDSFADLLNLPKNSMGQLLNERSPMTCAVALKLEELLSVKAESWMTMQQAVDIWDARTELQRIRDFGKSLQLTDFGPAIESTQRDLDATNAVMVAKAVSLTKATFEISGIQRTKG